MGILRFSVTNHNAALILSGAHVTPVQFKRLMTLFGDGESLFDVILTEREAIEKVTGKEKYEIIKSNCTEEYVEYNLAKYEKSGIRLISVFDGEYPERLRHSEGSPYMLYCRGDTGLLDAEDTIAVCGTRSCTTY